MIAKHKKVDPVSFAALALLSSFINFSILSKSPYKVDVNYIDNAVLLPTLFSDSRVISAQRVDYLKNFLTKHTQLQKSINAL
ncbi:hypothetical protein EJB10_04420 [Wolbachia endosymbiont of Brugia malayi]|uniref:hypothetical protein n=1 Tax=Wolbachia endosymbiont of Brugia malayi TaxID=80849 RepID=UPI0002D7559D|nr:hypothetical protein [Wolbachia endosymbiont of Brugia malayi]QCB61943.1 hypothetical protein EJB10_04420 [Wolbachia endosymbiont of Brugia malayi]